MASALLYTPALINLAYVRTHRGLETAETADDALLLQFIVEASAEFQEACERVLMPYTATHKFGPNNLRGVELVLRRDLLAVTTITNASGGTVSGSVYNLRPDDVYPKNIVELTSASGSYWDFTYNEDRVQITGIWGYAPNYARAWKSTTTLAEALDSSETAVDVTSATNISAGDHILVESEQMYVTSVSSNTLTVERGANGTTAAAHDTALAVYVYQQLADIKSAVREMVVWKYKHKEQIGTVTVFDGTTIQVEGLDPQVEKTRIRHTRRQSMLAV